MAPFDPLAGKADCMGDCNESPPDRWMDLTMKLSKEEIGNAVGNVDDGECVALDFTGNLRDEFGGAPIVGEDVVVILNKSGGGLIRVPVNDRLSTAPPRIEDPDGATHFDLRN